ncbi:type II secretion system protein [Geminisphaera colitermitum]|uniref:type II secretion system protein n=1 Tax=Geminisphaera colitermitum TaxID=1148786 RepID=UPI00069351D0|nr:type II secretion system protein [Geminisphaera colitermitum]
MNIPPPPAALPRSPFTCWRRSEAESPARASREARRAAAFTLIELLTVIAIIGVLAGIMIPVVSRVRESARKAQCISHLRQIGNGIHLFASDNKSYLPVSIKFANLDCPFGITTNGTEYGWFNYVRPYMGAASSLKAFMGKRMLPCPSSLKEQETTYTYYDQVTGYAFNPQVGYWASDTRRKRLLESISAPSVTPIIYEALLGGAKRPDNGQSITNRTDSGYLMFRHGNTANLLMVSGRVMPYPYSKINTNSRPNTTDALGYRWNP